MDDAWLWIVDIHNWIRNTYDRIMGIHICIWISITDLWIFIIQPWLSIINDMDVYEGLYAFAFALEAYFPRI